MHDVKIEITKFSLVGAANFVLTFLVFTVMLKALSLNYLLSLGTAWLVGTIFSYAMNLSWVFKIGDKVLFGRKFLRYSAANVLSITLNMLFLTLVVEYLAVDPFYAQMIIVPFVVAFNFTSAKFWSLKG